MMPQARRPKVYLAARYSRREELQGYAAQLVELGLADVPCRWLSTDHDWDGSTGAEGLARAQRLALDDVEDLQRCHAVVVFLEEAGEYRRGGSLVEFGMALGLGRHVVLVGPAPNVFATMPGVSRYGDWAGAMTHLIAWKDTMEQLGRRKALLV